MRLDAINIQSDDMQKTDILFVAPPFSYGYLDPTSPRCPPLGVASIAAVLEKGGYSVSILDAFSAEMTVEQVIDEVKRVNPTMLGLTGTTVTFLKALEIMKAAKEYNPSIVTVYGGPHVTTMPETAIEKPYVDIIAIGEGEYTALELCGSIIRKKMKLSEIKGIHYRENGKVVKNAPRPFIENLDELPIPAYHLLPMDRYRPYAVIDPGYKFVTMVSSRGCPYKCVYCTSSVMFGHRWRQMSVERTVKEIKYLYDTYGIRHIYFQDDEFTVNQDRTVKICEWIIENKLDLIWECLTRVNLIKEHTIDMMAKAGCKSIAFGIEQGYEEGLVRVRKQITLDQAKEAIRVTKKCGILSRASFIIGFPWEGAKEIKKTIRFAKELDADITYINILNPYPGTAIYDEIVQKGLLMGNEMNWDRFNSHTAKPWIRTEYLTEKQLAYWSGRAYLELYLRPKFLIRKIRQTKNMHDLIRNVKGAFSLIGISLQRLAGKKDF